MFERVPTYLSPTSIDQYFKARRTFVLNRLCTNRPPKFPQTAPMAAGSAFDAYVKNYIVESLYGKGSSYADKFDLEKVLRSQVEPQNLDWGREHGMWILSEYKRVGALANLMKELAEAEDDPRFELTVQGDITFHGQLGAIPLLGKPDCCFKHRSGKHVVFDWKVNGYCAKKMASAKGGWLRTMDTLGKQIAPKKNIIMQTYEGILYNAGARLSKDWELQVVIYGWLLGVPFGEPFFIGIEQLLGQGTMQPLKCASHRHIVLNDSQKEIADKVMEVWAMVTNPEGPNIIFADEEARLGLEPGTIYKKISLEGDAYLNEDEAKEALEEGTSQGSDAEEWFKRIR